MEGLDRDIVCTLVSLFPFSKHLMIIGFKHLSVSESRVEAKMQYILLMR